MPPRASACRVPALLLSVAGMGGAGGCLAEGPPTASSRGAAPSSTPAVPIDPPLEGTFEDTFDRAELGPDWLALSPVWKLRDGKLCAKGARNRGVWLRRTLPRDARIEVTAIAGSRDGDLKIELWGDGRSGASGASYDDATSYVAIFGGWRNRRHVLARLDEHADDRRELTVQGQEEAAVDGPGVVPLPDDPRRRPVVPGQPYRFRFERRDGRTLRWYVSFPPDSGGVPGDDVMIFDLPDDEPLEGEGHDHVGFNDWEAPVCFDDLRIVALGAPTASPPSTPAPAPGLD